MQFRARRIATTCDLASKTRTSLPQAEEEQLKTHLWL